MLNEPRVIKAWDSEGVLHYINPLEIESVTWGQAVAIHLKSQRFINCPRYANPELVNGLEQAMNAALEAMVRGSQA